LRAKRAIMCLNKTIKQSLFTAYILNHDKKV
jgi:hypothetical protein